MAQITLKCSHLIVLNLLLLLNVVINAHIIETTPLCGTMDGSPPPKDSDKIYFKDRAQGIRTVEVNGTIYACYPDGTMVDTASSSSAQASDSGETIDDTTLQSRIQSGKFYSYFLNLSVFFPFLFLFLFLRLFCCYFHNKIKLSLHHTLSSVKLMSQFKKQCFFFQIP